MASKKRKGEDLSDLSVQKLKAPKHFKENLIDSILNLTFLLEVDTNEETKYYAIKVKNESNTENKRNVELLGGPQQLLFEDDRKGTCVFNEEHNMYIYKEKEDARKRWETICEKMGVYTIRTEEEWERYLETDTKKETILELRIEWSTEFNTLIKDYPPHLQVLNMSKTVWESVNSLYFLPESTHSIILHLKSLKSEVLTRFIPKTVKHVTIIEKTPQDGIHFEFPHQHERFDLYNSMIADVSRNNTVIIYSEQEWNILQSELSNYEPINNVYFGILELNFLLENSHRYMRSLDLTGIDVYNTKISLSSLFGGALKSVTLNENHENVSFDHFERDEFQVIIQFKYGKNRDTRSISLTDSKILKTYSGMRKSVQEHGIVELFNRGDILSIWNKTPIELWSKVQTLKIHEEAYSTITYMSDFPPNLVSLFMIRYEDEEIDVQDFSSLLEKVPRTLRDLHLSRTHSQLFPNSFEFRSVNIFLGDSKFVLPTDFQKLQNYILNQKQIYDMKHGKKEQDLDFELSVWRPSIYFAPLSNHIWDWSALDFDAFYEALLKDKDNMKDSLAFIPMYFYKLREKQLKLEEKRNGIKENNMEEKKQNLKQNKHNMKEQTQYYMENEEQQPLQSSSLEHMKRNKNNAKEKQQYYYMQNEEGQEKQQTIVEDKDKKSEYKKSEEDEEDKDEEESQEDDKMEEMSPLSVLEGIFQRVSPSILRIKRLHSGPNFVTSVRIISSNFIFPDKWWTSELKDAAEYCIQLWFASKDFCSFLSTYLDIKSEMMTESLIFVTVLYVCERRHTIETLKKEFAFFQSIPHPFPEKIPIDYEKYLETLPLLSRALCVLQHWILYWRSPKKGEYLDEELYWYQRLQLICYPNYSETKWHIESNSSGNPIISKQYDDTILVTTATKSIPMSQFLEEGLAYKRKKIAFQSFHGMYEGEHELKFKRAKKRQYRFLSQMMRNTLWRLSTNKKKEMMWGKYGDEDMVLLYNMIRDPSKRKTEGKNPIGLYFAFLSYQILFLLLRISKPVFPHVLFVFRGITNITNVQLSQRISDFLKNGSEPNKQLVLQQLQSILHERQSTLFIATSADFETAKSFSAAWDRTKSSIIFKYHLPPSYPFIAMNDFFQFSFEEFELLLPADSRWTVDNFEVIPTGFKNQTCLLVDMKLNGGTELKDVPFSTTTTISSSLSNTITFLSPSRTTSSSPFFPPLSSTTASPSLPSITSSSSLSSTITSSSSSSSSSSLSSMMSSSSPFSTITSSTIQPMYFPEYELTQKQAFDELNAYLEEWTYENEIENDEQQQENKKHMYKKSKHEKSKSKKSMSPKYKNNKDSNGKMKKHNENKHKQQQESKKQQQEEEEEEEKRSISVQAHMFIHHRDKASYKFFQLFQQFLNSNKFVPATVSRFQSYIHEHRKPSEIKDMDELFFVLYQMQGVMKFTQKWMVEKQSSTFENEKASVLPRFLENVASTTFRAVQLLSSKNEIEADPLLCYTSLSLMQSKNEDTTESAPFMFHEVLKKRVLYFESFSAMELFYKELQEYSSSIIKKENESFWNEFINNYHREIVSNQQNKIPWLLYFCWYWKIEALVWKDAMCIYVSMVRDELLL